MVRQAARSPPWHIRPAERHLDGRNPGQPPTGSSDHFLYGRVRDLVGEADDVGRQVQPRYRDQVQARLTADLSLSPCYQFMHLRLIVEQHVPVTLLPARPAAGALPPVACHLCRDRAHRGAA